MSQIASTLQNNATSSANTAASSAKGGLNDLDINQFLNLMITELQNQDPTSPTDSAALIQQVGELRSISSSDKLVSTLNGFSTTQQLTTASSLIGKKITGLDTAAKQVDGVVSSVSVKIDEKDPNIRQVQVHVGDQIVDITNVKEIVNQ